MEDFKFVIESDAYKKGHIIVIENRKYPNKFLRFFKINRRLDFIVKEDPINIGTDELCIYEVELRPFRYQWYYKRRELFKTKYRKKDEHKK